MKKGPFKELRFRQVHLDFHTSEHIKGIGANFNEDEFRQALRVGHVNSITLFALCHHGWCYYKDSKVTAPHPHLETDLLPRMLAVCHEEKVNTPVYITVGWNDLIGREHPDWTVRNQEGVMPDQPPAPEDLDAERPWGWPLICLNTPYLDYLAEVTEEVMQKFKPTGIFYDITRENHCFCDACRKSMAELGVDENDYNAVEQFGRMVYKKSLKTFTEIIWKYNPQATVYHNSKDKKGRPDLYEYFSHYEVEALPSAWGYDLVPSNVSYFIPKGMQVLSMTGKFHMAWGEFGGFKNPVALKYECANLISHGCKCSVGDQMAPDGRMNMDTYRMIGQAYEYVEKLESWYSNIETVADIGILCPSTVYDDAYFTEAETSASEVMLQTGFLYDMLDPDMDFSKYKLLILPDAIPVNADLKAKLECYLKNGGELLLTGKSGLDPEGKEFQMDIGAEYIGKSTWQVDYTKVCEPFTESMIQSAFLNYTAANAVKVIDAEILANVEAPYFNRTFRHFCSHRNTPSSCELADYPAVIKKGNIIYMAHDIFTMYAKNGAKLHRDLIENCINLLMPKTAVKAELPSCGTITLLKQAKTGKHILNLLYAVPIKRGRMQVIEDVTPLYDVPVTLRLDKKISSVKCIPSGIEIDFQSNGDEVSFIVPKVELHQGVEIT